MAENASANTADPGADNNAGTATGTAPAQKTDSGNKGFDPSTLTDEDFGRVFQDPRLFTHDRFKALNEQAKEAKKLQAANEASENARLAEEKKYKELAQKHEKTASDYKGKYEAQIINNKIQAEATKLGITDIDAAGKLVDRAGISIDDDGNVSGVEEAVKALAESKSYLVDKSKQVPVIGSPSNPQNGNTGNGATRQFKASEIADPKFYKEHAKDIDASLKAGVPIIDDRGNTV